MAWRWSANVYFKITQNNALSELNEIYGKTPNLDSNALLTIQV